LTFIITITELRYAALTLTLIAKGSLVFFAVFRRTALMLTLCHSMPIGHLYTMPTIPYYAYYWYAILCLTIYLYMPPASPYYVMLYLLFHTYAYYSILCLLFHNMPTFPYYAYYSIILSLLFHTMPNSILCLLFHTMPIICFLYHTMPIICLLYHTTV